MKDTVQITLDEAMDFAHVEVEGIIYPVIPSIRLEANTPYALEMCPDGTCRIWALIAALERNESAIQ